ncbi:MAG: hypothetical protein HQL69_19215 [Magnetococcales bacterium]|nr:hypothetical protein [Magnetococcales bacterium]
MSIAKKRSALKESAAVSVITSTTPDTLTKRFFKDKKGKRRKVTIASLKRGRVRTVYVKTEEEFKYLLMRLENNQALTYGISVSGKGIVITVSEWNRLGRPQGYVPRSKQAFPFRNGPGIMMFDYDPQDDVLGRWDVVRIFCEVCPGLRKARFIWWPSSGSYIYEGEKELIGLRGQRFYFFVRDASDIPRAGKALETYLWAAGYGHIKIISSGSMLPRTLVDTQVWQGNRLDFASGAECDPPYEQRRGDPKILKPREGDGGPLDTKVVIPEPDEETVKLAAANIARAKEENKEEALAVRQEWMKRQIVKVAAKINPNNPTDSNTVAMAAESVRRAVETRELDLNWILHVEVESEIVQVTVGDVLADPAKWNGLHTKDPIEPDYDGGRIVGKLFLTGAKPNIHSFARGGCTYFLVTDLEWVEIVSGRDVDVVDETLSVMRRVPLFFDFGDLLVAFDETDRMLTIEAPSLGYFLGRYIQFGNTEKNEKDEIIKKNKNPPSSICSKIISLSFVRNLRPLKGVITAPSIRPDGTIFDQPGYDLKTQLLFIPSGDVPLILTKPTHRQIRRAAKKLWQPFRLFPFVDAVARGVHFAAMLSALTIHVFKTRPCIGYDATSPGSGKTLLAQCLGALVLGRTPGVYSPTNNDEEIRKTVFSALTAGETLIVWDNVDEDFYSKHFANLLTTPTINGRPLGESMIKHVPNTSLLVVTGNNLTVTKDMGRRMILARIDPEDENPEKRPFDFNPLEVCLEQRQELNAAGLTVLCGFIETGKPRQTDDGPLGSFEDWDEWIRQCVVWIGNEIWPGQFDDPLLSSKESAENDPDRESYIALLEAWRECYGDHAVPLSEVMVTVNKEQQKGLKKGVDSGPFKDPEPEEILVGAIQDLSGVRGDLSSQSLGRMLSNRKGRVVNGLRLVQGKKKRNGAFRWKVEEV